MAYRTDDLQEAGLTEPPKSINDILTYANKLVKKNADGSVARAGYDMPLTAATVYYWQMMFMFGAPITSADGTKALCTDEASVKAFQLVSDLAGQSIPYKMAEEESHPFFSGNAAIDWMTSASAKKLQSSADMKDKVKFVGAINDASGKPMSFCGNYVMTMVNTSKNKDVAWQFMQYMLSKDQMEAAANEIGAPVMRESLASAYIAKNPDLNTAILDSVKYGKSNPVLKFFTTYNNNMQTAFESVINHTKTPAEALAQVESATNKELGAI
jgi:ABC-type glycerol-3-phosphate transport system substrate-binding protein